MKGPLLSICIPTYEMQGEAKRVLARSFNMLKKQTFKDFEIVISDNSENDVVKNLCANPEYRALNINYFKNQRKGITQNTNAAIQNAQGEIIKILYMDDYLAHENSLQNIVKNFHGHWLVTGCGHDKGDGKITNPHFPRYNKKMYLGKNTIGAPSVLTIKNENPLLFDENLTWLLDCDYYKRLYDKYGEPTILNEINVGIGTGKHQMTNILKYSIKLKEKFYLLKKHKQGLLSWVKLW